MFLTKFSCMIVLLFTKTLDSCYLTSSSFIKSRRYLTIFSQTSSILRRTGIAALFSSTSNKMVLAYISWANCGHLFHFWKVPFLGVLFQKWSRQTTWSSKNGSAVPKMGPLFQKWARKRHRNIQTSLSMNPRKYAQNQWRHQKEHSFFVL